MAQPNVHGRFVWQELIVQDGAAAAAFYSKVVGWRTQAAPAMPEYTMFTAGTQGVGGMPRLPGGAGVRAHWLPYIGAQDVDETAAAAVRLGGKLIKAPFDLPNGGRVAELTDPQGAGFGLYHSSQPGPAPSAPHTPGLFSWQELATTDYEAAFAFYRELFSWNVVERSNMGPSMVYLIFGWDGAQRGGIYKSTKPGSGAYWLPYVTVTDIDATVATVSKAGGQIVHGPVPVPGGGRIAQLLDPAGALFAVHMFASAQPAVSAPKPAPARPAAQPPKAAVPAAAASTTPAPKPPAAAAPPKLAAVQTSAPKPAVTKTADKKAAGKPAAKTAVKKAVKKAAKKTAKKAAKKAAKKPARKQAARKPIPRKKPLKKKGKAAAAARKRPRAKQRSAARRKK
jgi:predicted enzyme related to lactoylglutathione lyase